MAANTWKRGDLQIILSDEKPAFYQLCSIQRSPCPRISGESFIFEPMKGQVQSFDSASWPVKLNVKPARYVHES